MKWLLFISFVVISFASFIFGCSSMQTYNINITDIAPYPQSLFEPLQINVGAYYGEEFRTFDTIQHYQVPGMDLSRVCKIQIGKANIALFEYILSNVFEKVKPIQFLSKGFEHLKDVDLIIEPTVHNYNYTTNVDSVNIHIIYAINFFLPGGEHISSWSIEGSGHVPPRFELKCDTTAVTELNKMAMRDVAAQFMTGFCNQIDIQKHFYKQCNR
jgi:hypothetical protein